MKQYAKHDGSAVTKDIRPQIKLCRKEEFENLWPQINDIFDKARQYMRRNGNNVQWTNGYPQKQTVASDVADGCFYLICLNGRIVACFCMRPSPEPTYAKIYNGQWPDDEPYNVIHRLASDGSVGGIALLAIRFALDKGNLRVDTHELNSTMISILEKEGFIRCGTIYVADGTPRIAFQKQGTRHTNQINHNAMNENEYNLQRFIDAQETEYATALSEIRSGGKRSHWIWYIFPQQKGLGHSYNSEYYGLDGTGEARAYLAHPLLGARLREISGALLEHKGRTTIRRLMGSQIDVLKLRTCMQLFDSISPGDIFAEVLDAFFNAKEE